jgi:hypothetical protein
MGEKRDADRILMGKPKGKIPLGRPRCRWVDNINIQIGSDGMDWIDQLRALVNMVMNLRVP